MIPDYKLYHGAVLAELVDVAKRTLSIGELVEEGRLSSYVLDGCVGLYVKHSAARMPPWQFTFTDGNRVALCELQRQTPRIFVVLVCWLDGMVCLSLDELATILGPAETQQGWVRVERRKNEWYAVSGAAAELPHKKPRGVAPLVEALSAGHAAT
jgi:hypothetical protein